MQAGGAGPAGARRGAGTHRQGVIDVKGNLPLLERELLLPVSAHCNQPRHLCLLWRLPPRSSLRAAKPRGGKSPPRFPGTLSPAREPACFTPSPDSPRRERPAHAPARSLPAAPARWKGLRQSTGRERQRRAGWEMRQNREEREGTAGRGAAGPPPGTARGARPEADGGWSPPRCGPLPPPSLPATGPDRAAGDPPSPERGLRFSAAPVPSRPAAAGEGEEQRRDEEVPPPAKRGRLSRRAAPRSRGEGVPPPSHYPAPARDRRRPAGPPPPPSGGPGKRASRVGCGPGPAAGRPTPFLPVLAWPPAGAARLPAWGGNGGEAAPNGDEPAHRLPASLPSAPTSPSAPPGPLPCPTAQPAASPPPRAFTGSSASRRPGRSDRRADTPGSATEPPPSSPPPRALPTGGGSGPGPGPPRPPLARDRSPAAPPAAGGRPASPPPGLPAGGARSPVPPRPRVPPGCAAAAVTNGRNGAPELEPGRRAEVGGPSAAAAPRARGRVGGLAPGWPRAFPSREAAAAAAFPALRGRRDRGGRWDTGGLWKGAVSTVGWRFASGLQ